MRVLRPETELVCIICPVNGSKCKIAPAGAPEDGCHPEEAKVLQDYYYKKVSALEAAKPSHSLIQSSETPYDNL